MIKTEIKNDITVLCLIFLNNKCLISARLIQIHVNGKKSVQCKTQTADPKNSSLQSVCSLQFTLPQRAVHHGKSMCSASTAEHSVFCVQGVEGMQDKSEKTVDVFRAVGNRKEKCDITLPW